jgi:acetyl-CoA carboxylase carboxyl transferase subunit alpha
LADIFRSMRSYLDFEKPVAEIEAKLEELRALEAGDSAAAIGEEITRLEVKAAQTLRDLYASLTPWQKTQVARHPDRPHCLDYVAALITDFAPLAGDRKFGDDDAIVGGFGRFHGESVCVIGHEKGSSTGDRLKHNFGMARPEGYRKAERLMQMADRFGIPVISLVDTAGAYPGIGAEERGQAEAIARSTEACLALGVPNVAVILGEGGSGGAIALATANRVLMLEHAIYSVISPEGAASILWRDTAKAQEAATGMKITAQDMVRFGVIDQIVTEPIGGAHRDPAAAIASAESAIVEAIGQLRDLDREAVRQQRRDKFLAIGRTLG